MMKMISTPTKTGLAAMLMLGLTSASQLAFAGEHTVKAEKFQQVMKVGAVAMPLPNTGAEIMIKPAAWGNYKIESLVPQGTVVKKGDVLITADTKKLDEHIIEKTKERIVQKLNLEKAEQELAELKEVTQLRLDHAKMVFDRANADYAYYKNVTRPEKLKAVAMNVKSSDNYLAYEQEELDQLLKMYKEDDLTEETEEIIIRRAKDGIERAKFRNATTKLEAKKELEVVVPRLDEDWKKSNAEAKRVYESNLKTIPRNLKIKQEEVAKLRVADTKAATYLADLKADRALVEFKSPIDGVVYYGQFKGGSWHTGRAQKHLFVGADIPHRMVLMTVVPTDVKLAFNAFLTESNKALYSADKLALAKLESNAWKSYPMQGSQPSPYPNLSHQWLVRFTPKEKLDANIVIGSKAKVSILVYEAPNALTVPVKAVKVKPDGTYSVKVKMAEGAPQEKTVTVGKQSGDTLEILSGIDAGQVIITP